MAKKKKTVTTKSSFGDETTVEVEDTTEVEEIKPEPPKLKPPTNSSSGMFGLDETPDQSDWRGQKPT